MPVTETERLDLPRWSDDADPVTREQFDAAMANLEARAAAYLEGVLAARPAAGAPLEGFFYWATDQGELYYCDGVAWIDLSPVIDRIERITASGADHVARAKRAADPTWRMVLGEFLRIGDGTGSDVLVKRYSSYAALEARAGNDGASCDFWSAVNVANRHAWSGSTSRFYGFGTGSPEGAVSASVGSMWLRTDATDQNATAYLKVTGTGNTGWVAVAIVPTSLERVTTAAGDWLVRGKRAGDTQYRVVVDETGVRIGPGGTTAPFIIKEVFPGLGVRNGADTAIAPWVAEYLVTSGTSSSIVEGSGDGTNILKRAGSPEGVLSAGPGSSCLDKSNGKHYTKSTGAGNTGWVVTGTQT